MRPLLPLLVLASFSLRADTFASLKEQLQRLPGSAPVKGTLDLKTWNKGGKGKEAEESTGTGSVWVEDTAQGLRLMWSRALVQQLEQEARLTEKDPKAKTPLTTGLSSARPALVLDHVNAAGDLLRELERGKVLEEKAEPWNGQPARLLTLEVAPKVMSEEDKKRIKKHEARLQVWIGEGGLPLASRLTLNAKGSFMLMSFEMRSEQTTTFTKIGDRLVATRREKKENNTVPIVGEVQSHTVTTFSAQ